MVDQGLFIGLGIVMNTCNHIELEFVKAWHGDQDIGHAVLDVRCTKCGRTGSFENCFEGCCCIRYDFEHDKLINNYRIVKKGPVKGIGNEHSV